MSLNIYVKEIQDESLHYQMENGEAVDIAPMAKNIGFWCLSTDIGQIESGNVHEWYARYEILKSMGTNFFCDGYGHPVEITFADLLAHVGLRTNVTTVTRTQWLKNQVGGRMDDAIRDRKRALKTALDIALLDIALQDQIAKPFKDCDKPFNPNDMLVKPKVGDTVIARPDGERYDVQFVVESVYDSLADDWGSDGETAWAMMDACNEIGFKGRWYVIGGEYAAISYEVSKVIVDHA